MAEEQEYDIPEVHDEGATMTTASTGGSKQQKDARFDLIPPEFEWKLAELYGAGVKFYSERNWERGYEWSLSYAAARRHMTQFWAGEIHDAVTGAEHVVSAAWHCAALSHFASHERYAEFDDRPIYKQQELFPEEGLPEQQELFPKTIDTCPGCGGDYPALIGRRNCAVCYGLGVVDKK